MPRIIFTTLLLMTLGCSADFELQRIDGSTIKTAMLTQKIQSLMDAAEVTGLAVSVFNANDIVYQKAFGLANADTQDSLQIDALFYGASFSKAVFGYIVAQLVEEGVIDLDVPLQNYLETPLPEIVFAKEWRGYANLQGDDRYKKITGRMCLSHSTGFPNWRWITKEGVFNREGKIHFMFEPGTRYSYSGEGINLLQFVIEQITQTGLETLAQERVFKPLKMNMTSYVWQEKFEGKFCLGHTTKGAIIPKDREDEANAAGSMETTLVDYSKFIKAILEQSASNSAVINQLFHPNIRIHSKAQFGPLAWEDSDEHDDIQLAYGLGWGLMQTPYGKAAFKEGHSEGFQHYSIVFPEQQIGLILLSNSDNAESIFRALLTSTIRDTFTPWKWENYIPYDAKQ